MQLLEAAGLPAGVINLVLGDGPLVSDVALNDPRLAGIHFTGSTATFQTLWQQVGNNSPATDGYPRLVGETGGKDFVVAHTLRRSRGADHGPDPGRLRLPGPEVLGRLPRVRAGVGVGEDG